MVVLAVWLLRLDYRSPVNQAFAVLLLVLGGFNVASALLYSGEFAVAYWLYPLAQIAVPFATLYFVGTYRSLRVTGRRHPALLAVNASGGLVLVGAFVLAPGLFWPTADKPTFGPLFILAGVAYMVSAVVALQLGLDYLRAPKGRDRRSLIVMSLGFAFLPGYVAAQEVLFIDLLRDVQATGIAFVAHMMAVMSLGPLIMLFGALAREAWKTGDEEVKRDLSWFLLVFLTPLVAVGLLFGLYSLGEDYGRTATAIEGAWTVVFPLFVGYGVLRHRLWSMDTQTRRVVPALLVLTGLALLAFWIQQAVVDAGLNADAWIVGAASAALLVPLWPRFHDWADRIVHRVLEGDASWQGAEP